MGGPAGGPLGGLEGGPLGSDAGTAAAVAGAPGINQRRAEAIPHAHGSLGGAGAGGSEGIGGCGGEGGSGSDWEYEWHLNGGIPYRKVRMTPDVFGDLFTLCPHLRPPPGRGDGGAPAAAAGHAGQM